MASIASRLALGARGAMRVAARPVGATQRFMAIDAKVVKYNRYGAPENVLSVETESVSEDLKANEVLVKMLAAPITVSDFSQIKGFNSRQSVPAVGGNEGVGQVMSVGSSVSGLSAGDFVVPAKPGFGTWRTHAVAAESDLAKFDGEGVQVELAATSVIAPITAARILSDFADLKEGDVIVQNNAGSTVGQAVMQLAAARGIKTINILRHRGDWDDIVNHFHGLGANIVVNEDFARTPAFTKLIADLPAPKLGLNSVGGSSVRSVAAALGDGATLVTIGGASPAAVEVPLSALVERDITVRGFNFNRWWANASSEERSAALGQAASDAKAENVRMLLAREPFKDFDAALARAQTPAERKVVLVM